MRAKLILQLDKDACVAEAAKTLDMDEKTVRRWRDRFLDEGRVKALRDGLRSGRPVEINAVTRCELMAMACGKPADFDVRCRQVWTIDALRARFLELHAEVAGLSRTSVLRILNQANIRPHRIKM